MGFLFLEERRKMVNLCDPPLKNIGHKIHLKISRDFQSKALSLRVMKP